MHETVTSDLASPLIAALYVLLLPVWLLVLAQQLGAGANSALVVVSGVLVVASVPQFLKGIGLFRQRVEADAAGIRLSGLGGFDLPWSDVVSITITTKPRTGNVLLKLAQGRTIPSDAVIACTGHRRVGVQPQALPALRSIAQDHGVSVS